MFRHPLRTALRLFGFCTIVITCLSEFVLCYSLTGKSRDIRIRAHWLSRWARRTMRVLNIHARYEGTPPAEGVMVCNHLTYIDIVVLAANAPMVFVAKSELRRWPVVGWLCSCAGTLFINRQKRGDVKRLGEELAPVVSSRLPLCIFPEGTSSDGSQVLPFYSSLLAPATEQKWPVTPACISYSIADGSVEDEICYWREMVFAPHLLNLLSKRRIDARVAYGPPAPSDLDRKEMAKWLHAEVSELNRRFKRHPQTAC